MQSARPALIPVKARRPRKLRTMRFLSIGRSDGHRSKKSYIRLRGYWLADAGFLPGGRLKVTVLPDRLILEPVMPGDMADTGT